MWAVRLVTLEDEDAQHQLAVTEQARHESATPKANCRKVSKGMRIRYSTTGVFKSLCGPSRHDHVLVVAFWVG